MVKSPLLSKKTAFPAGYVQKTSLLPALKFILVVFPALVCSTVSLDKVVPDAV